MPPAWEALIYPAIAKWGAAQPDHRAASLAALAAALAEPLGTPPSPTLRLGPPRPPHLPPVPASLEGVLAETEVLSARLMSGQETSASSSATLGSSRRVSIPSPAASMRRSPSDVRMGRLDPPTAEILLALATVTLRGCRTVEARTALLRLLGSLSPSVPSDARASRALPYLLTALSDPTPQCRYEALRALGQGGLLPSLDRLPPHELSLFTDYVLPSLSALPGDPEDLVRDEAIAVLAEVAFAVRRLEGGAEGSANAPEPSGALPAPVAEAVRRQLDDLSSHASTTSWTRHSLLSRLLLGGGDEREGPREHPLGFTDDVLGLAITFLNDREAPHIRPLFFERVGRLVPASSEAFLVPLLEDQLAQGAEGGDGASTAATAAALQCATTMAKRQVLSRRSLLRICPRALPLLRHASPAVQHAACALLQAACAALPPSDAFVFLRPLIKQAVALPSPLTDPSLMARALMSREAQLTTPLLPSTSGRRVPDRLNPNAGYLPEERAAAAAAAGASTAAREAPGVLGPSAPGSVITGPTGGASSQTSSAAAFVPSRALGGPGPSGSEPRALTRDLLGRSLLLLLSGEASRWTLDLPPSGNEAACAWMGGGAHAKEAVFGAMDGPPLPPPASSVSDAERADREARRFESRFHRARAWLHRQMAQSQQVSSALSSSALQPSPGHFGRPMPAHVGARPMSPGRHPASPQSTGASLFTAARVSVPHLFTALGRQEGPVPGDGGGGARRKDGRMGPGAADSAGLSENGEGGGILQTACFSCIMNEILICCPLDVTAHFATQSSAGPPPVCRASWSRT